MTRQRSPEAVDVHVGSQINMRRRILGISQTELGNCIGVSFQQVQKYEKGKNRVSSGRLQQIADLLKVEVPFFFEGLDGPESPPVVDEITNLCRTPGGLALATAFQRVKNKKVRKSITQLVSSLADTPEAARED